MLLDFCKDQINLLIQGPSDMWSMLIASFLCLEASSGSYIKHPMVVWLVVLPLRTLFLSLFCKILEDNASQIL